MAPFLPTALLPDFLEILATSGALHGPVVTDDGIVAFGPAAHATDCLLEQRRTLLPPKKYLFPQRETTLVHDVTGYHAPEKLVPEIVLIGIHKCDIAGIAYLDRVFLGEHADPFYSVRRDALTLVGVSCTADEFCFCGTMYGRSSPGYDLFLDQVDGGYLISEGSEKGRLLLEKAARLCGQRREKDKEACSCREEEAIREAVARGERFDGNPLWDQFAAACLSCGACSLCCPTCYCFDVRETGGPGVDEAERLREWDNCLFVSHGEIAGGHNFRPTRRERFHYRFQHKYLGFGPTRGIISCVGCGRCRQVCPVGIDLLRLFLPERGERRKEAP